MGQELRFPIDRVWRDERPVPPPSSRPEPFDVCIRCGISGHVIVGHDRTGAPCVELRVPSLETLGIELGSTVVQTVRDLTRLLDSSVRI